MPIIGKGMLARAFSNHAINELVKNFLIFSSGVSNSSETSELSYDREKSLLTTHLNWCKSIKMPLIYFSTCSIYDSISCISTYASHKSSMESLVTRSSSDNLVIRLPQVVGNDANASQLIPFLFQSILTGKKFPLRSVSRNLVHSSDLVFFVNNYIQDFNGGILDFSAKYNIKLIDIVTYIESKIGLPALYEFISVDHQLNIPISNSVTRISPHLLNIDYCYSVIDRYEHKAKS